MRLSALKSPIRALLVVGATIGLVLPAAAINTCTCCAKATSTEEASSCCEKSTSQFSCCAAGACCSSDCCGHCQHSKLPTNALLPSKLSSDEVRWANLQLLAVSTPTLSWSTPGTAEHFILQAEAPHYDPSVRLHSRLCVWLN